MLKNRKVQIVGTVVLIIAAILVTLSAVRPPASVFIPVTGSNSKDLSQYYHSEHMLAYPANSNEAGLAQYHLSEWGAQTVGTNGEEKYHHSEWGGYAANQRGLAIYYQSERMQPVKWAINNSKLNEFHQSEWLK